MSGFSLQSTHVCPILHQWHCSTLAQIPPFPAAGCLRHAVPACRQLTSNPLILETIQGYRLELAEKPRQAEEPPLRRFTAGQARLLRAELVPRAPERGCHTTSHPDQFVSPLFIIPKWDGKRMPVIDMRDLIGHLEYARFKREGLHTVRDLLRPGDFLTKVDLKDAYFAVTIAVDRRDLLRFRSGDQLFEFPCCHSASRRPCESLPKSSGRWSQLYARWESVW